MARLGSIAFGPAVYYAATVTVAIILSVGLLRRATTQERCGWIVVLIALAVELISTFTRGGYLALAFILFLPFWKKQRRFALRLGLGVAAFMIAAGRWVLPLVLYRPFDIASASAQQRVWLAGMALPHFFDRFGFGYGIGNYMLFVDDIGTGGVQLPVHSLILEAAQMVGGLATSVLLVLFTYIAVRLWRVSRTDKGPLGQHATYLLIAMLGWHAYANTTGTSILCYAPQEATALVYVLLFLSVRVVDLGSGSSWPCIRIGLRRRSGCEPLAARGLTSRLQFRRG